MAASRGGADRDAYVANFQRRVIQSALTDASVWYYRRRAATFNAVGTTECDEIATACSNHAAFIERYGLDQDELLRDLFAVAVFGVTDEEVA
ncbi:hypothetical protein [Solicola gregarius]|uniref:Uncharacterized protein n=1 Tax=Solicola gregarius TaxID=2908642 RepID=A0AA46YK83_9ACTN|nr:hypothetical protein [Solicola gregarius]UYM05460.1 hypothetical protein L0C25_23620 [Solicola gregarius]